MSLLRLNNSRSLRSIVGISAALLLLLFVALSAQSAECPFRTLWEISAPEGFSAPNLVHDTNTGKVLGIAVANTDSGLVLIKPDGTIAWEIPLQPPINAAPAVCDLDADGQEEIIAVDCVGNVVCVTPDGETVWTAKLPDGITGWGNPSAADINGDGKAEVIIGDRGGNVSCLSHDGQLLWRFQGEPGDMGTPLLADIYDTFGLEIIITSHEKDIYALDSQGGWLWDIHIPNELFPNSAPVMADIAGTGKADLFVGGGLNHLVRIDLATLEILDMFETGQHINDVISVADLNGDGRETVIAGTKSGNLLAYGISENCPKGGLLWRYDLPSQGPFLASPPLINLDDDPDTEVLLLTARFDLMTALNPDGTVLWQYEYEGGKSSLAPCAGDIDSDGTLDLVMPYRKSTGGKGYLSCISFGIPYSKEEIRWESVAANPANTCRSEYQRTHNPLPVPQGRGPRDIPPDQESRGSGFTLDKIFTGPNTWRHWFPKGRVRKVFLTEIISPSGIRFLSAKHGDWGGTARIDFDAYEKGNYSMYERLLLADSHSELERVECTEYSLIPFQTDIEIFGKVLDRVEAKISAWNAPNPIVKRNSNRYLSTLRQDLAVLSVDPEIPTAPEDQPERIQSLVETRESIIRFRKMIESVDADSAQRTFLAWTSSPWSYFDPRESVPSADGLVKEINIGICRNEYEPAVINLTNVCGQTIEVRVIPSDLKGPETLKSADCMEFRRSVTVATAWRQEIADALPLLDQGRLITLPPWESAQLWITFKGNDAEPGTYEGTLQLTTLEVDPSTVEIPISLTLYDLSLPRPRPLRFCTWSYVTHQFTDMKDEVRDDLIAHANTVFLGPCPNAVFDADGRLVEPIDYKEHDEFIRGYARHGFIMFIGPQGAIRGRKSPPDKKVQGPKFLSEAWERGYAVYLKDWVTHLAELGVGYENFALYPYDEPNIFGSEKVDHLIAVGKATRAIDPNILIYTDPTTGSTAELIEALAPVIDIWCPSDELLERHGDTLLPIFKRTGKEVWFYDAAGHSKTLSTLGIYRWRPWEAWRQGFTGCGHWVYSSHSDDLWAGPNPSGNYYPTVYDGKGVVSSKRWEACREGAEDYEYLCLLRDSINSAQENGGPKQKTAEAQKLLDRAGDITFLLRDVGRRIPLDLDGVPLYEEATTILNSYRKEIVEALIFLQSESDI
ncbi:MAG: FG-GAP-like repeat-containing protein [bacterium]